MGFEARRGIPLRADLSSRPRAAVYLERAVLATAAKAVFPTQFHSAESFAREKWGDGVTEIVLRSAVLPAATSTPAWAGTLARDAVADFISSLAPMSAAAKLFNAAPRVSLVGLNTLKFPARSGAINPTYLPWVVEGDPAPVLKFSLSNAATLGPTKKLMAIAVTTRECAESGSADVVITTLLKENCSLALDATVFSNAAATAAKPAGILNGVSALSAAPNGDDAALTTDLTALAGAIAGSGSGLAFVCNPAQAAAIKIRRGTTFPDIPVWSSIGVPAGTVIALNPDAFVSAFGPEPEVQSSIESVLHIEDASPQPPVAAPETSLFQTECLAVKLRLYAAWAWRMSGAVAWIQNTTW